MNAFPVILVFLISNAVIYYLTIAYIGVTVPLRKTLVPIILLSIINYFIRKVFLFPMPLNAVIVVLSVLLVLYLMNKVNLLLCLAGTLLSFITEGIGSTLIVIPTLSLLGFTINTTMPTSPDFLYVAYGELVLPIILIFILRATKVSIQKYVKL